MIRLRDCCLRFLLLLILAGPLVAEPVFLVMVGPPGAGKGTQATKLSEHYQVPHISTGAMLRDHIKRETELGLQAKDLVESGELVPDDIIVAMLKERLSGEKDGFILDGFPRSREQARILDEILQGLSLQLSGVVFIDVPEELVLERLLKRGRKDDTPEVIKRRLEIYEKDTAPVIEYYESAGTLLRVKGHGSIEEVQERIRTSIDAGSSCCGQ